MTLHDAIVYVIDDDDSMRGAIERLVRAVGLKVEAFKSGEEFLVAGVGDAPCCLVLDVRLKGTSGLDLQRTLAELGIHTPIVFVTGHGDIPMSVQAMKAGAIEFLTKPFRDQDLLDAISVCIERDRHARIARAEISRLQKRLNSLTPREHEVMEMVVRGKLNKQIALSLGSSEKTVKIQRANVMLKMKADSVADLVRMSEKIGLLTPKP